MGDYKTVYYKYDYRSKDVLIRRLDEDSLPEILHKGDRQWESLTPSPDYKDEEYCRAIYFGQGCWADLKSITEEEAAEILEQWAREAQFIDKE